MYQWRGLGDSSSIQALISSLAPSYGIPPNLALAVAKQESGFQPNVVSSAGAVVVMQLMPGTAASLGVTDSTDPTQNINGGLSYLQQMYAKFGNWTQALEAYNAGPNGNLAGSAGYANAILANAGPLSASAAASPSVDLSASTDSGVSDDTTDYGVSDSSGLSTSVILALAAAVLGLVVWAAA